MYGQPQLLGRRRRRRRRRREGGQETERIEAVDMRLLRTQLGVTAYKNMKGKGYLQQI
jgi:hypothetical protein